MQISLPLTVLTYKVSLGGIEYLFSLGRIFFLNRYDLPSFKFR